MPGRNLENQCDYLADERYQQEGNGEMNHHRMEYLDGHRSFSFSSEAVLRAEGEGEGGPIDLIQAVLERCTI